MKKLLIFILFILCVAAVNAEFDSYSTVYYGTHNSTSSRITTVATLLVSDLNDNLLLHSLGGGVAGINSGFEYQISDLNYTSWQNIAWVDVNCTRTDSTYDSSGNFVSDTDTLVISSRYTTANTPTTFVDNYYSLGRGGQVQCMIQSVYKTNTNITLAFPYTYKFFTPTYGTDFATAVKSYAERQAAELALQQAQHTLDVTQAYNDNIANYTTYMIRGVYELWLILFFAVKIALIYVAFLAVIMAIAFPIFLIIRFRKKVREWMNMNNEVH
jgi:hypothetical protein